MSKWRPYGYTPPSWLDRNKGTIRDRIKTANPRLTDPLVDTLERFVTSRYRRKTRDTPHNDLGTVERMTRLLQTHKIEEPVVEGIIRNCPDIRELRRRVLQATATH